MRRSIAIFLCWTSSCRLHLPSNCPWRFCAVVRIASSTRPADTPPLPARRGFYRSSRRGSPSPFPGSRRPRILFTGLLFCCSWPGLSLPGSLRGGDRSSLALPPSVEAASCRNPQKLLRQLTTTPIFSLSGRMEMREPISSFSCFGCFAADPSRRNRLSQFKVFVGKEQH